MYDAIGVRRHAGMQTEVTIFSFLCTSFLLFLLSSHVRINNMNLEHIVE